MLSKAGSQDSNNKKCIFALLKQSNHLLTLRAKGWIALFRVTEELAQYTNFREKEKEILDRVMDPKRWVFESETYYVPKWWTINGWYRYQYIYVIGFDCWTQYLGTSDYSCVFHEDTNMKDQTSKESSFFAMIISDDVSIEHNNFVSRYDSRIRPAAHPSDMKMSE